MSIFDHCRDQGEAEFADHVLHTFEMARRSMEIAAATMHQAGRVLDKRYDRSHKAMRRLMREWNRIEQEREADIASRAALRDAEEGGE